VGYGEPSAPKTAAGGIFTGLGIAGPTAEDVGIRSRLFERPSTPPAFIDHAPRASGGQHRARP
jgi:hypothetical protein